MLTKSDLQQIQTIIRNEVYGQAKPIKNGLENISSDVNDLKTDVSGLKSDVNDLKTDVSGLKSDVNELKTDVSGLKSDVTKLTVDMKGVKKSLKYLTKTVDIIVKNYDENDVKLERRVMKIEKHIGLIDQ